MKTVLPIEVPAETIRRLMREKRVTIRQVATIADLPMTRVREVRERGGPWDWPLIIDRVAAAVAAERA